MKLVIEAGSTKCRWGICSNTGNFEITTYGFNPNFLNISVLRKLINDSIIEKIENNSFESIYYFGTGCANKNNQKLVKEVLTEYFQSEDIKVVSDLEGAAKAIFKDKEGLIGILGTGASAGYYDGNIVKITSPSIGFLMGDEGSGAYLGKELIKRYLRDELDYELTGQFRERIGMENPELIKVIYSNANMNSYLASFVDFIVLHQDHPIIKQLLTGSFMLYYEKHFKPIPLNVNNPGVGIIGGIAWQFNDFITKIFRTCYSIEPVIKKEAFDELIK